MSSRRALLESLLLSRLPSAFQEVEYIESSGTQYIDSGFVPNQDTRVVCDLFIIQFMDGNSSPFGSRTTSTNNNFSIVFGGTNFDRLLSGYGNQNLPTGVIYQANQRYLIDKNKNVVTVNDDTYTNTSGQTFACDYTLYLFALNNNGFSFPLKIKVYSCQIYDNNILVRDFVPCYRKSDNEIGLYDLVNGVFYTNAGTGIFAKGPNV